MSKKYEKLIEEYEFRRTRSDERFRPFKQMICNARKAFRQVAPPDIIRSIQSVTESGNGGEIEGGNNNSVMLHPMYSAICNKMIESLHGLPPRYEWSANTNRGIATSWALELELMKCYTKSNIGAKIPLLLWHLVVDGLFAQQTVYRAMEEKIRINGEVQTIYNGGSIDFVVYDPLTCYFDWDADITDIRRTSNFFIATISTNMTRDGLAARFGEDKVKRAEAEGMTAKKGGDVGDAEKAAMQRMNGYVAPIDTYILREYYTKDGKFYSIVNDEYVIDEAEVGSGVADQIPINIGVAYYDADTKLGSSLWERVKWSVALMSQAINQVADRNAFNNHAPMFTTAEMDEKDFSFDASTGRRLYRLISNIPGHGNVNEMISQLMLPEVLPGAQFMFQQGMQAIFYVTGTNSMAFGIQDKQIRTADVASMISQSLVRSDSDIAKKLEVSFFNPVTWDFLRIFYVHYNDFPTFKENNIPQDFLKNYKDIRVVNGSYLTADKAERLGKLQQVFQLAQANPNGMRLQELYHDMIQAIGFINPSLYLKSEGEVALEAILYDLAAKQQAGLISEEELTQVQSVIQYLIQLQQRASIEGGDKIG